jgi:transketolase
MQMLPGMTVLNPCDFNQTKAATIAIASHSGPVYLRFGRPKVPIFIPQNEPFIIGKALMLNEGMDVSIFSTGHLVWKAIQAGIELEKVGISAEIINLHTIKPLDKEAVVKSVRKTGCAVTAEEHQILGGMGSAVAQCLATEHPAPIEFVGVKDKFGESGTPEQLMVKYGLEADDIVKAVLKAIQRKSN